MSYIHRIKTPIDHRREMLAIAQTKLVVACRNSRNEPDDAHWSKVIARLAEWVKHLQHDLS